MYKFTVSYKLRLSSKWAKISQPHPSEEQIFNNILGIVRREVDSFEYDGRNKRRQLSWMFNTSRLSRNAETKVKRLRRVYPRLNIKTEVHVAKRSIRDNLNTAIDNLLSGSDADSVVEDLSRTSALYAATMMHFSKLPKASAEKRADEIVGSVPADDTLWAATMNTGIEKTTPTYAHIVKMGHYKPEKTHAHDRPHTHKKT